MTKNMATETRPEKLKIWPVDEGGFGIDVRWSGGEGDRHATVVREQLVDAGVQAQVTPNLDGRGWELRVGPVPADQVAKLIESYIW